MPSPILRKLVINNSKKYMLDNMAQSVFAFSLRKLKSNATKCIRIRRSDDNVVMDIGFSKDSVDNVGILNFLERNILLNPALNSDVNSDGIADNWIGENNGLTVSSFSIDDGQKLTITNANRTDVSAVINQSFIVSEGDTFTLELQYKTEGNVSSRYAITSLPGNTIINTVTSKKSIGAYTYETITGIVPSSQTSATITLAIRADNIGDSGSVWYRNIKFYKTNLSAYVVKLYDQTGNGFDVSQSITTKQPLIVESGALITLNNKPAIQFIEANQTYLSVNKSGVINQPFTLNGIGNKSGTGKTLRFVDRPYVGALDRCLLGIDDTNDKAQLFAGTSFYGGVPIVSEQTLLTGVINGSNSILKINKNNTTIGDSGTNNLSKSFSIGWDAASVYMDCKIQEITCFNGIPDISLIETNQSKYYGIS